MIDLAGLQSIVAGFFTADVSIRHRGSTPSSNRSGDDVEAWTSTITVKGWLVNELTKTFGTTGGMGDVTDQTVVRVPVGTVVGPRDEVTVNGSVYTVVETSNDETWPVMLKVSLVEIE